MASSDREGVAEGIEHVQAAAREMIKATRSFLDAAEGLVEDPAALQSIAGTLAGLVQAATGRLRPQPDGHEGDDEGGVERITLS
jgi:hypothetical protein